MFLETPMTLKLELVDRQMVAKNVRKAIFGTNGQMTADFHGVLHGFCNKHVLHLAPFAKCFFCFMQQFKMATKDRHVFCIFFSILCKISGWPLNVSEKLFRGKLEDDCRYPEVLHHFHNKHVLPFTQNSRWPLKPGKQFCGKIAR